MLWAWLTEYPLNTLLTFIKTTFTCYFYKSSATTLTQSTMQSAKGVSAFLPDTAVGCSSIFTWCTGQMKHRALSWMSWFLTPIEALATRIVLSQDASHNRGIIQHVWQKWVLWPTMSVPINNYLSIIIPFASAWSLYNYQKYKAKFDKSGSKFSLVTILINKAQNKTKHSGWTRPWQERFIPLKYQAWTPSISEKLTIISTITKIIITFPAWCWSQQRLQILESWVKTMYFMNSASHGAYMNTTFWVVILRWGAVLLRYASTAFLTQDSGCCCSVDCCALGGEVGGAFMYDL